jgi:hypothetical protein
MIGAVVAMVAVADRPAAAWDRVGDLKAGVLKASVPKASVPKASVLKASVLVLATYRTMKE